MEVMCMYKVTNKFNDVRKFRDGKHGRDILVNPNESVLTNSPPEESDVWKVEKLEETPEKKTKKIKGED
jgi:hypothetical protein